MATIALYNLKGGVGKTASAVNLAYLAAADGLRTLIWDLDPQGSSTFYLLPDGIDAKSSKQLFNDNADANSFVRDSAFENLWIIPADLSHRNADVLLDDIKNSKKKLQSLVKQLKDFDVIILDCPPGLSLLHDNIFNASDVVLMPNIPTTLSINSYETVAKYFDDNNIDKTNLKCFFSMVDHRKNLHHEVMQQFYKDKVFLKNYVPYLSDIEKMGVNRKPLFEFANSSYAANCYRDLWKEIKKLI